MHPYTSTGNETKSVSSFLAASDSLSFRKGYSFFLLNVLPETSGILDNEFKIDIPSHFSAIPVGASSSNFTFKDLVNYFLLWS